MAAAAGNADPRAARSWRHLLPREHGSWSLVGEPLALGLLAAPSLAGLALAFAVFAAFLARRPLGLWVADPERWPLARVAAISLVVFALAGASAGVALSSLTVLAALGAAAPFAVVFLWLDLRRQAREEAAEVAGALAFAVMAGALAVAAGQSWAGATGLAFTAAARMLAVVLAVRACLRARKGELAHRGRAVGTAWALALASSAWSIAGGLPWLIAALAWGQVAATTWLVGPAARSWSARRIGTFEAWHGGAYVVLASLAWRLGF